MFILIEYAVAMVDNYNVDRRTVLKSGSAAVAGAGGLGILASPAAARCNTQGGTLSQFGIDVGFTVTFCDDYIEWELDHPVQSGTCRLDADSNCDGSFNFGAATVDYVVEGSPYSEYVNVEIEVCRISFSGWKCSSGSIYVTPGSVDYDVDV